MENIEHNLGWYVKSWCEANPSAALLLQMDEKNSLGVSTYSEVYADVLAWAEYFRAHGVKAGDRVARISHKSPEHFRFF